EFAKPFTNREQVVRGYERNAQELVMHKYDAIFQPLNASWEKMNQNLIDEGLKNNSAAASDGDSVQQFLASYIVKAEGSGGSYVNKVNAPNRLFRQSVPKAIQVSSFWASNVPTYLPAVTIDTKAASLDPKRNALQLKLRRSVPISPQGVLLKYLGEFL